MIPAHAAFDQRLNAGRGSHSMRGVGLATLSWRLQIACDIGDIVAMRAAPLVALGTDPGEVAVEVGLGQCHTESAVGGGTVGDTLKYPIADFLLEVEIVPVIVHRRRLVVLGRHSFSCN
ncbi:hypothetical protein D3C86_1781790 [compost metagenome]